ncbi:MULTISPECIES: hypothetical protein [Caballeronia]|jgi:hypothetical protein|uniref:Uncharacterized protein n=1 Tax=Caballeronia grimmiae TaxID=1071679 RepID=A0A069P9H7_9BURK|nr:MULTISPECIES: hypothetical protein [Caballeronia]KDR36509.1 hypothetical protein BG57_16820 [Caballeronia grimmiae]MDR5731450.1 hypothetical protein [Caballeronia sp. LZ025]GGD55348.1 hypothetical protein GCM10010985_06450 [Caballeronia grimmiae]
MARSSIGVFGALFAVGSVLAWKWMQSQDGTARRFGRDARRTVSSSRRRSAVKGDEIVGGTADAWHFPRS